MGSRTNRQSTYSNWITLRIRLRGEVHSGIDSAFCSCMVVVAPLFQDRNTGSLGDSRRDFGCTLGLAKLDLGRQSVRALPERMVSESLLSRRHGTLIYRHPPALSQPQALVADPLGSDSARRDCKRNLQPGVSHASLEPVRASHAPRTPPAVRGVHFRRAGVAEYRFPVFDPGGSLRGF